MKPNAKYKIFSIKPMKLFLSPARDVNIILRSKKKIESGGIKLNNDLTLIERTYLNDLRTSLNSRIAGGEKNLTIRYIRGNPTIVKRDQKNG